MAGVIDWIAAEAKYHLVCFKAFTRMSSKLEQVSRDSEIAMAWLCGDLQKIADKGQIVQLNDVWERYETFAKEASVDIRQSFCSRRSTFKEKLHSQLGDAFTFFQPLNRCVEERKTILIPKNDTNTLEESQQDTIPPYKPEDNATLSLVHIIIQIRADIMSTRNHRGFSVSEDDAISCVPDSLYMLLLLIFGGQAD